MSTRKIKYDDISIKVTGPDDLIRKVDELFFNYLSNNRNNKELNTNPSAEPNLVDWTQFVKAIRGGKDVQIGDSVFTRLVDGTTIEFVITDVTADSVRFESKGFIGERVVWNNDNNNVGGYPISDIRDYVDTTIWELLPEDLQNVISVTNRTSKYESGYSTCITKLYLPAASEIFDKSSCFGDNGLYKQLNYYKNAQNRVRVNEKGNAESYWLASVSDNKPAQSCIVRYDGSASRWYASFSYHIPVCFNISKN